MGLRAASGRGGAVRLSDAYVKELEGPITAKTANTLTVLGQTVIVDNLTKIETTGNSAATIGDLAVNDIVEVSGSPSATGIRAP